MGALPSSRRKEVETLSYVVGKMKHFRASLGILYDFFFHLEWSLTKAATLLYKF